MTMYIITCNYFHNGIFGIYSSLKRARMAFLKFIEDDDDVVSFEDTDFYSYQFTTKNGETYGAEIYFDIVDYDFEEGIVKEGE